MNKKISIVALASYIPSNVMANHDFEKSLDTSDEWISTRTGIRERRIATSDESTSTMGIKVAQKIINAKGIDAEDIGAIILATMTPDYYSMPPTSCVIQSAIGAKNAFCLDLPIPCSGFIYAISIAQSFFKSSMVNGPILVIASEKMSSVIDYEDRSTCVLFGDGAVASLIDSKGTGIKLGSFDLGANGNFSDILMIEAGGSKAPATIDTVKNKMHFIKMQGRGVFKQAIINMFSSCKNVLEKEGISEEDISWVIPHQANLRIINSLAEKFSSIDRDRVYSVVDKYGNTSCASIGIALVDFLKEGKYKIGDKMLFTAFGGGMTWGSCVVDIEGGIDIE